MKNIVIQPYTAQYQEEVIELILNIQRNEFGVAITRQDQPDLADVKNFYQQRNGNFWIAMCDDKVIGTIALIDIGQSQIALRKMFVHQDYRGKEWGTAQILLDTAQQWMHERKCSEVMLGTLHIFHAAIKFYERNGFTEVAKADLPPNFPIMKQDTMFFKKVYKSHQTSL